MVTDFWSSLDLTGLTSSAGPVSMLWMTLSRYLLQEGAALGLGEQEREQLSSEVVAIAARSGFPVYFSKLEQVL